VPSIRYFGEKERPYKIEREWNSDKTEVANAAKKKMKRILKRYRGTL
jgi:hypothetical protein